MPHFCAPTPLLLPRWDQLLEAATRETAEDEAAEGEEGGSGGAHVGPEVLRNMFRSLVMERYVERVPPCTLPPPANQVGRQLYLR